MYGALGVLKEKAVKNISGLSCAEAGGHPGVSVSQPANYSLHIVSRFIDFIIVTVVFIVAVVIIYSYLVSKVVCYCVIIVNGKVAPLIRLCGIVCRGQ